MRTMNPRRLLVAVSAVLTGLLLLRRLPVRTPGAEGSWHPLEPPSS